MNYELLFKTYDFYQLMELKTSIKKSINKH